MMNIKEIIISATAVVGVGLGIINTVSNRKNKKNVSALEQKINDMNAPRVYPSFNPFQNGQPQPNTPTAE